MFIIIIDKRKKKGLSQDRLSKLADVAYNTIIKIESVAIQNPRIETVQKITRALNVSLDELRKA